jgi:hypothetical protein
MVSPLLGAEGNVEFLLAARAGSSPSAVEPPDQGVDLEQLTADALERQGR